MTGALRGQTKGMAEHPQQQEIERSGRGDVDRKGRTAAGQAKSDKSNSGRTGPVPPENQPGHHPEREQDKPAGLDRPPG